MVCTNKYHTCLCGRVSETDIDQTVRVAGWVENIRDHGGMQFLGLRDHYGVVQVVVHNEVILQDVARECTVSVEGKVTLYDADAINPKLATGTVEIKADTLAALGKVTKPFPFEVPSSTDTKENARLKHRFLGLRNPEVHNNIVLRSQVISFPRQKMAEMGFLEIQTPIPSTSSPEGARDYLIPSRKHHGKFYALPQAPQIFKQLPMVSGFDRYFQIVPCLRNEDVRADRSPGEFCQLDFELTFVTQEDAFSVTEEVLSETSARFSNKEVSKAPYVRILYQESMLRYGTDKPNLRNPLEIIDISDIFDNTTFAPFKNKTIRAIRVPGYTTQSKSFFKNAPKFATEIGMEGLGYISVTSGGEYKGPINRLLPDDKREELISRVGLIPGDVISFIADERDATAKLAGQIRTELGRRPNLIDESRFETCFIVDFPVYEIDEETGKYIFTRNPSSMPQGGLGTLQTKNPEEILAYQHDIVCNGVELSSGAVKNRDPEVMVKAFGVTDYAEEDIREKFGSLCNAFRYGASPRAGIAPGVDRMVILLTEQQNIREVIPFLMNSNAQDLLLGAPTEVTEQQLRKIHIKIR